MRKLRLAEKRRKAQLSESSVWFCLYLLLIFLILVYWQGCTISG